MGNRTVQEKEMKTRNYTVTLRTTEGLVWYFDLKAATPHQAMSKTAHKYPADEVLAVYFGSSKVW